MKYIKLFEEVNEPEVYIDYFDNGQKKYEILRLNSKLHSEDGLAIQKWYDTGQRRYEVWFLNGKIHREDGPARQWWYETGQKEYEEWYLNGIEYSKEEWIKELKRINSPHYEEQKILYDAEKYNL